MKLSGLHLLLTYQCTFECDHCFAWGSPWQDGTMTLQDIRQVLQQADQMGGVEWIYFEGGEPFLYYRTLLKGVEMAARAGYRVGIIAQPALETDADIARLGEPRLFWGVTGGSIDSMVANHTASKKRRF